MYDHGKYQKIDISITNHDFVMFPTFKDYEQLPKSIIDMAGDEEKFFSCQHPHNEDCCLIQFHLSGLSQEEATVENRYCDYLGTRVK